jgi:hypothetical protein
LDSRQHDRRPARNVQHTLQMRCEVPDPYSL